MKDEAINKIELEFKTQLGLAEESFAKAQSELEFLKTEKERKINEIENYFEAMEKIKELQAIISNKPEGI